MARIDAIPHDGQAAEDVGATGTGMFSGLATALTERPVGQTALKPGDLAPDFSLQGSDGRRYRLQDLAGSVVVLAWFQGVHRRLNG